MLTLYGIPNCDTMKKARKWLDAHDVEYVFHDYKKLGIDEPTLREWVRKVGWETLLNRRGMMWRKVPAKTRDAIDESSAIRLMLDTPSTIKRPVLVRNDDVVVGFSEETYGDIFD